MSGAFIDHFAIRHNAWQLTASLLDHLVGAQQELTADSQSQDPEPPMSLEGHERTHAPQQTTGTVAQLVLFNHPVGAERSSARTSARRPKYSLPCWDASSTGS